jgi:pyrroline-5-carboxylate reductase
MIHSRTWTLCYNAIMAARLAIIGAGNMGSAIVRGAVGAQLVSPADVLVVEPDDDRRRAMQSIGCRTSILPRDAIGYEQIMLAVKPQTFAEVAEQLGVIESPVVIISIMAGVSSDRIRAAVGEQARIIRVMPNTPAQIGAGAAAIAMGAGALPGDESLARTLFESVGRVVIVEELLMDAVTATCGSGPAYVFLLAEAMEQAAIRLGIDAGTARALVTQTICGAGRMLIESSQSPSELRAAVTSRGGTTAAALDVFQQRQFIDIVIQAMSAARDRSRQLGRS